MPSTQPSPGRSFLDSMSITHHLAALTVRSILSSITRGGVHLSSCLCPFLQFVLIPLLLPKAHQQVLIWRLHLLL